MDPEGPELRGGGDTKLPAEERENLRVVHIPPGRRRLHRREL